MNVKTAPGQIKQLQNKTNFPNHYEIENAIQALKSDKLKLLHNNHDNSNVAQVEICKLIIMGIKTSTPDVVEWLECLPRSR